MTKIFRYIFIALLVVFLGYRSVYFRKLSDVKNQTGAGFNFNAFADSLYYKGILKSNKVTELNTLWAFVQSNPGAAFKEHGNVLGIGNSAYFMVKSSGKITEITESTIKIATAAPVSITLDTKYIFGNALRDASGLVKLTDFKSTADFNKVSESLNHIVREKVIPVAVQKLKKGDEIGFVGALKLSKKHLADTQLTIIPAQITLP